MTEGRQAALSLYLGEGEWRVTEVVEFWVSGTPRPKGSYRPITNKKTGFTAMIPNSKHGKTWAKAVAAVACEAMRGQSLAVCPVRVLIRSLFPRPKAHYYTKAGAPDLARLRPDAPCAPMTCNTYPDTDKLARNVLDALTGAIYADDGQCVDDVSGKGFVPFGEQGGQMIRVEFLEEKKGGTV